MYYQFSTDNLKRAKAALILYAVYKSRNQASSLNGLETWNRFTSFIRGACLKSTNTAEFVNHLCKMADTGSIKPIYLKDGNGLVFLPDGTIAESNNIKDFKVNLFEDDSLLELFENEGTLLVMLVRERLEREKMEGIQDNENED